MRPRLALGWQETPREVGGVGRGAAMFAPY
ncbi:hypothetical protein MPNT_50086 [Candidatus Methylacidithermus pantelleriae]|uniref:Uncharacterized protein n=1 Tax=Candidatus Methylacidithermus pantelleriae TaxID=2744239 RepID=A0A8J2BML8_9BACT|nr:hypothetical protein MPNT_50086 [Candidatus Methylacidithermus pantelleriae]